MDLLAIVTVSQSHFPAQQSIRKSVRPSVRSSFFFLCLVYLSIYWKQGKIDSCSYNIWYGLCCVTEIFMKWKYQQIMLQNRINSTTTPSQIPDVHSLVCSRQMLEGIFEMIDHWGNAVVTLEGLKANSPDGMCLGVCVCVCWQQSGKETIYIMKYLA